LYHGIVAAEAGEYFVDRGKHRGQVAVGEVAPYGTHVIPMDEPFDIALGFFPSR
jgi:hypothetical protein